MNVPYEFDNLKYTVDSTVPQTQPPMNYMNIKPDPLKRQPYQDAPPVVTEVKETPKVEDKGSKDSENLSDDESLGSDLSEDEELQTENYMICLFEKVKKTKVKRKAFLKDAVLHVNGRDFILKECNTDLINKI